MPMRSKEAGKNISEFHHGSTYEKTKKKFGKAKADKQAVAAGIHAAHEASSRDHKRGR